MRPIPASRLRVSRGFMAKLQDMYKKSAGGGGEQDLGWWESLQNSMTKAQREYSQKWKFDC